MSQIAYADFETGAVGSAFAAESGLTFPATTGLNLDGNFCLLNNTSAAKILMSTAVDTNSGNVILDGLARFNAPSTNSGCQPFLRCTDNTTANFLTTASHCRMAWACGSAVASFSLIRFNGTTTGGSGAHTLATLTVTSATISADETFHWYFTGNGNAYTFELQQVTGANAGKWLTSSNTWQTSRTAAISVTDNAGTFGGQLLAASTAGYYGVRTSSTSGSNTYLDDVQLSDLSTNAIGHTLAASPGSVATGSPSTITATLVPSPTGGTTLSASTVITLVDNLASTISGTITIANGSTTGTATVTPTAVGTHNITSTHTGGGYTGGNGSTSFAGTTPGAASFTVTGGASIGTVGVASSNFTVTPNAATTDTFTPSAIGGLTGTFSPTSLGFSSSATPQTFTFTPTSQSSGAIQVASTNGLTNSTGLRPFVAVTSALASQTFESSGSLPAGYVGSMSVDTTGALAGANSLLNNAATAEVTTYGTLDGAGGNCQVSWLGKGTTIGSNSGFQPFLRSSVAAADSTAFMAGNSYRAACAMGSGVTTWDIRYRTGGVDTVVGTAVSFNQLLKDSGWYRYFLSANGSSLQFEIQQVRDDANPSTNGQWAKADGTGWQASRVACLSGTNTSLTSAGYSGIRTSGPAGASLYVDDFVLADLSVPATGFSLSASPGSVSVGSPSTITATLTGGTALTAPLVITLADNLAGSTSGTITINNGSTTGTATRTPSATGTHNITSTYTGGNGGMTTGSTSFAATSALATIAANDSNWVSSPGNWDVRSSSLAVAANHGAWRRIGFTGTSCVANFNLSSLTGASVPTNKYPKIAWSIDNGAWQTAQIAATVSLATGLASGTHSLQLVLADVVAASDSAQTVVYDRYVTPVQSLYLSGLTVDSGAASASVPSYLAARARQVLVFGNSMSAGTIVIALDSSGVGNSDGRYTWGVALGEALNADVGLCAWPGQSYDGGGSGGVPRFYDPTTQGASTLANITQGRARSFTGITDAFFAHGVIEASDPSSSVIASLGYARSLLPAGAKMWQVIPFGGRWRSQVTAAVATYKANSGDSLAYVLDLGTPGETGLAQTSAGGGTATKQALDGYHPNQERQAQLGAMEAKALQAIEGGTTPATAYLVDLGTDAPVAGERYRGTIRLPAGTTLAADATITLAGGNITYSATQGGTLASPGTAILNHVAGVGAFYWSPTAAGGVTPTATNGSGLTNPTIAPVTASAAPAAAAATAYAVKGIPSNPVVGATYTASVVLNNPASASGTVTPTASSGITYGAALTLASGGISGDITVLFTQAGTYAPAFTHTGLGFSGDPTLSAITAVAPSSGGDPATIAAAVVSLLNTTAIPVTVKGFGDVSTDPATGGATAMNNMKADFLADPVQVADIGTDAATKSAALIGVLGQDAGTISASPAPNTTTFSATGSKLTAPTNGYVGMFAVTQGVSGQLRRLIVSHQVVGSRHDFVIDGTNPLPAAPAAGSTIILG
jgi:hypothetical protein